MCLRLRLVRERDLYYRRKVTLYRENDAAIGVFDPDSENPEKSRLACALITEPLGFKLC